MAKRGWSFLEAESAKAFVGRGAFPLRAYSEFMPAPWVGFKPYRPERSRDACTAQAREDHAFDITEAEQVEELQPGLDHIASHVLTEIAKLARGTTRVMSRTLLEGNPAWPRELLDAAAHHGFRNETFSLALPLALSRTQDDKGNVRWTLFGASHLGSRAFWESFADGDAPRLARLVSWMAGEELALGKLRVLARGDEALPAFAKAMQLEPSTSLDGVRALLTFVPFAQLPEPVRKAYLAQKLLLVPSPGSLVFGEHPRYAALEKSLPRAMQIPLLHLFPRVQGGYAIRIPQSGWLDEYEAGHTGYAGGHRVVTSVVRTHRWEKVERDQSLGGDMAYADHVATALFSTAPDDLGLYGKPMARNAQIWSEDYQLLLDGPRAHRAQLEQAARHVREGGRFGYRFYFPPMRAGTRELFWHLPLVARLRPEARHVTRLEEDAPLGLVTAESLDGSSPVTLTPRLLARPEHELAATLFPKDPGHARNTTAHNVRKVLDFAAMHGGPLAPSHARSLLQIPKHATSEEWLARLTEIAAHPHRARPLVAALRTLFTGREPSGTALTFEATANRAYEERLWTQIAALAEGNFHGKENADVIAANAGRTGGQAAKLAQVTAAEKRDLGRLGDHLHAEHNALIQRHGMAGKAEVVDHVFRWETDFEFPWSQGWASNQGGKASERNIVVIIPGRNRGEAVVMADHYDTAYMEDVYEEARGGDGLRAAAHGADDNHSGTASLLAAANVLLPLAREGKLERDVWLVHLTGEEFPSDCLGARALAQALVEKSLTFTREDGALLDASQVEVAGVYVLDMVAHNNLRDRDTFFICPGEGAPSARLALHAHQANVRWNASTAAWNGAPDRAGKGRAQRMPDGKTPPPPFAHLQVFGNLAAEWEPRSVLYNTDGQIFSDVGVPVVLFMENYDINRSGYHDTHDTMANIDLDYAAAITAIAIETVAQVASAKAL